MYPFVPDFRPVKTMPQAHLRMNEDVGQCPTPENARNGPAVVVMKDTSNYPTPQKCRDWTIVCHLTYTVCAAPIYAPTTVSTRPWNHPLHPPPPHLPLPFQYQPCHLDSPPWRGLAWRRDYWTVGPRALPRAGRRTKPVTHRQ